MADEPDAAARKAADVAARRAKRRPAPEIDAQAASPDAGSASLPNEPTSGETFSSEPVSGEPISAEPVPVEPAPTETAHIEPAPSVAEEAAASEPVAMPMPEPIAAHEPDTAPETVAAPAAAIAPPRRRSVALPLAIGLVVGAAAAVGGAYAIHTFGLFGATNAESPRLDALARRLDETDKKLAALTAAPPLAPRLDALTKKVDALPPPPDVAALETRVATLEKPQADAGTAKTPAPDLGPLTDQLQTLERKVATLPTAADMAARTATPPRTAADLAALSTKVDTLAGRLTPLEALAAPKTEVRAAQEPDAHATTQAARGPDLAIVAADLTRRITSGQKFDDDLAILTTLGADPAKLARLKPLAGTGVTTSGDLAAQFAPLAGPILAAGEPAPTEGLLAHLERSAGALVRVQKVDGSDGGTDLPSRVARLQALLARGDVAGALASWRALPDAAKAKSQSWSRAAEAYADALATAQGLAADAVTLIGKGRS